MKYYITKYALTAGIVEREGEIHDTIGGGDMLCCKREGKQAFYGDDIYHGKGRDWHETREGAVARSEQMRVKKIASLKKQVAKLEALKFT